MTERNEIEFLESVGNPGEAPAGNGLPGGRSVPVRIGIVAGAALLVVVGAVAAMGASPSPSSTTADPSSSAAPGTTQEDPRVWGGGGGPGFDGARGLGMRGGGFGRGAFHDIGITAISGSNLSLATDDGWTRTIAVTSATTVTRGGATITLGDLAVDDQIRFSQTRGTDGTYTITAIHVVLPSIAGEVTVIDGNTLTVTQPGGTTATIHMDGDTTYQVQGVTDATVSDIKVGSFIVAEGTQRTDGSLDAATVRSGFRGPGGPGGHGFRGDGDGDGGGAADPNVQPAPSTTPG